VVRHFDPKLALRAFSAANANSSDAAEVLGALLENTDYLGPSGNAELLSLLRVPRPRRVLGAKDYSMVLNAFIHHVRESFPPVSAVVRALGRVQSRRAHPALVLVAQRALHAGEKGLWEAAFNALLDRSYARRSGGVPKSVMRLANEAARSRIPGIRARANGYLAAARASRRG
jgi:hypothetical protein